MIGAWSQTMTAAFFLNLVFNHDLFLFLPLAKRFVHGEEANKTLNISRSNFVIVGSINVLVG